MFEKIEYIVERIDGDYAFLKNLEEPKEKVHFVLHIINLNMEWIMIILNNHQDT